MKNLAHTKVSRIVADNYRAAKVFTAHGIDFCCNGGISLDRACQQNQADLNEVIHEVKEVLQMPQDINYSAMSMAELVDHIVNEHHAYVRSTIPALTTYLKKLCQVHGERHPELLEINLLFGQAAEALGSHMNKEEQILFPYIKALQAASDRKFELSQPHFGHIENPISMMESEHEKEGARFRMIREMTSNYMPPREACQTYRVAFMILKEFETDLHKHIHLENNILFPQATMMYEKAFA